MIEKYPYPGPMLRPEDFEQLLLAAKLEKRPPWPSLQKLATHWMMVQSETTTRRQYEPHARAVKQLSEKLLVHFTAPSSLGHAQFILNMDSQDDLMLYDLTEVITAINEAAKKLEAAQKSKGRSTIKWLENPLALLLLEFYAIGGKRTLPSNEASPSTIANNSQHAFAKCFIQTLHQRAIELDLAQRGPFWSMEVIDHLKAVAVSDSALVKLLRRARRRSLKMKREWLYPYGTRFEDGRTIYREI